MLQTGLLVDAMASMGELTDELMGVFGNPALLYGIPLAIAGAVCMAFGAFYQHRGVAKVEAASDVNAKQGLGVSHMLSLTRRPSWLVGTLFLALGVICQLFALAVAPLIVVQPIGAIALVITVLINWRSSGIRPSHQAMMAITACLVGIGMFVTLAALFATEHEMTHRELWTVLIVLGISAIATVVAWLFVRGHVGALFYVIVGGSMYGFVATLAKVVISRLQAGEFDLLTWVCVAALIVAFAVGTYFVQSAYASGSSDLVVAGLTVVDPMVAVLIALLVLREAAGAPTFVHVLFVVAGAIAIWGVFRLAKSQTPLTNSDAETAADAD